MLFNSDKVTSPPNTPRLSARSPNRRKKHSLPNCATLPVPIINNPYEEGMRSIVARLKILSFFKIDLLISHVLL